MNQMKPETSHVTSGVVIPSLDKDSFIQQSNFSTQKAMHVSLHNIPRLECLARWSYMKDIKVREIDSRIDLLIGTNVSEPWELINGQGNGPYTVKNPIGLSYLSPPSC